LPDSKHLKQRKNLLFTDSFCIIDDSDQQYQDVSFIQSEQI